ncbi:MAG: transcriptional regulator [Myxococcales bacterium]|nr:transcriptional regulator [Myxococcales bacterium]
MTERRSEPREQTETARRAIAVALEGKTLSARELSQTVRISEHEVGEHLRHLELSLAASGRRLVVEPASCKACAFSFAERARHGRPSRCPKCKSERLAAPRFRVEG